MAGADETPDIAEQAPDAIQHALALDRVRIDDRPLLRGQCGRLVDDLRGDPDLAHVVQEGRELGAPPLARRQAEAVGHREREQDDLARVVARVLVVGLDHVAEKERGAAVGVAELERVVDPPPPLLRQEGEQREEREDDEEGSGWSSATIAVRRRDRASSARSTP